jgi:N-acyl-D-amino-acid deacylase
VRQSIHAIATELGKESVSDVFLDIVVGTDAEADFLLPEALSTDTEKVAQVLRHPLTVPGTSDGGAHVKFWSGRQFSTDMIM